MPDKTIVSLPVTLGASIQTLCLLMLEKIKYPRRIVTLPFRFHSFLHRTLFIHASASSLARGVAEL